MNVGFQISNLALISMKKIIFIGVVLFVCSQTTVAQTKWYISPVLGMNMTPVKESPEDPSLLKTGVSFGALTGPLLKDHWRLSFGLTINQRYSSYSYQEPSASLGILTDLIGDLVGGYNLNGEVLVDSRTEYWTVDFPVTVDYVFKSGFFFTAGLYANTTTSANNVTETTTDIPILDVIDLDNLGLGLFQSLLPKNGTKSKSSSSTKDLNSSNFGLLGGFGADAGKIQLKIQYQYGFNDIRAAEPAANVSKQQAISFHIAYLFFPTVGERSTKLKPRYDLELIK